jgi:hypothetical protein
MFWVFESLKECPTRGEHSAHAMVDFDVAQTGKSLGIPHLDRGFGGSQQEGVVAGEGHRPYPRPVTPGVYGVAPLRPFLRDPPHLHKLAR